MSLPLPTEKKILAALFLTSSGENEFLSLMAPEWQSHSNESIAEKLSILPGSPKLEDVFPWKEKLSPGIDFNSFLQSFFIQPQIFLRVRPGFLEYGD